MRLVGVELTRLRSRRAVVFLLAAAVLLIALVGGATAYDGRPVSDNELAYAQRQVDRDLERPATAREIRRCERDPVGYGFTEEAECEEQLTPQVEWYLSRYPLALEEQREGAGLLAAMVLIGLGALVGATYAGADWASGSMSNQLLVEPRRSRVWAAKAAALAAATAVATLVLLLALWALWWVLSMVRDLPVADGVLAGVAGDVGRATLVAAGAAVGAFALAMAFRNTGATIAVLFLLTVASELLVGLLPLERPGMVGPGNNLFAVLSHDYEVFDDAIVCPMNAEVCDQTYVVTFEHGLVYLAVVLGLVVAVSLTSFRRRDVP